MSRRLRVLNAVLRRVSKPALARVTDPAEAARDFDRASVLLCRPAYLRRLERPGGLHWISAGPCVPGQAILYLHGGGYISGSPATHEGIMARLSRLSRTEICAPAYPLAQDAPFPAAFDHACAAWARCRALGYPPERILLAGDSAGGGLALALLAQLCVEGTPPAGAMAFSPWTDLAMSGESLERNRARDPFLPVARMADLVALVAGTADRRDPRLSPLYGAYPGCPPVFLSWSETEILADDGARMAARLGEFGARVETEIHPDAPHAWPVFDGWIPEARATLRRAAAFAQASLGAISR